MSRDQSSDAKKWGVRETCKRQIPMARTHQLLQGAVVRQHVESGNDYANVIIDTPVVSASALFSPTKGNNKKVVTSTDAEKEANLFHDGDKCVNPTPASHKSSHD